MIQIEKILKKDGVGILATDTLYGVVGSAYSKKAVKRVFGVKGRDSHKPLIVLIASMVDLSGFGIKITPTQKQFLDTVWPGPVSVILPCLSKKFEYIHRGSKSIAFRLPKNKKLQELLKKTGPLVAPSANPQGGKPATTIRQAKKYFSDKVDFYVTGRPSGKASTIIDMTTGIPQIIRKSS